MIIIEKEQTSTYYSMNGEEFDLYDSTTGKLRELFSLAKEDIVIVETEEPKNGCFTVATLDRENSWGDMRAGLLYYTFPDKSSVKLCRGRFYSVFDYIIPEKLYISI